MLIVIGSGVPIRNPKHANAIFSRFAASEKSANPAEGCRNLLLPLRIALGRVSLPTDGRRYSKGIKNGIGAGRRPRRRQVGFGKAQRPPAGIHCNYRGYDADRLEVLALGESSRDERGVPFFCSAGRDRSGSRVRHPVACLGPLQGYRPRPRSKVARAPPCGVPRRPSGGPSRIATPTGPRPEPRALTGVGAFC